MIVEWLDGLIVRRLEYPYNNRTIKPSNNPLLPLILLAFPLFLPQVPLFPDLLTQRLPAVVSLHHQTKKELRSCNNEPHYPVSAGCLPPACETTRNYPIFFHTGC